MGLTFKNFERFFENSLFEEDGVDFNEMLYTRIEKSMYDGISDHEESWLLSLYNYKNKEALCTEFEILKNQKSAYLGYLQKIKSQLLVRCKNSTIVSDTKVKRNWFVEDISKLVVLPILHRDWSTIYELDQDGEDKDGDPLFSLIFYYNGHTSDKHKKSSEFLYKQDSRTPKALCSVLKKVFTFEDIGHCCKDFKSCSGTDYGNRKKELKSLLHEIFPELKEQKIFNKNAPLFKFSKDLKKADNLRCISRYKDEMESRRKKERE